MTKLAIFQWLAILGITFSQSIASTSNTSDESGAWRIFGFGAEETLPFVASTFGSPSAYEWPALAIKVEEVECDGRKLVPTMGVSFSVFNSKAVKVGASKVVYLVPVRTLLTIFEYHAESGDYGARVFYVPEEAKQIVIKYRVRTPIGTESTLYTLIASLRN